jgi:hypothetical protein
MPDDLGGSVVVSFIEMITRNKNLKHASVSNMNNFKDTFAECIKNIFLKDPHPMDIKPIYGLESLFQAASNADKTNHGFVKRSVFYMFGGYDIKLPDYKFDMPDNVFKKTQEFRVHKGKIHELTSPNEPFDNIFGMSAYHLDNNIVLEIVNSNITLFILSEYCKWVDSQKETFAFFNIPEKTTNSELKEIVSTQYYDTNMFNVVNPFLAFTFPDITFDNEQLGIRENLLHLADPANDLFDDE